MSNRTIASLCTDVQTFTFNRGKGEVEFQIDLDSLTEAYYRKVGERHTKRVEATGKKLGKDDIKLSEVKTPAERAKAVTKYWEATASSVGMLKELRSDQLLSGVLVGWNLEDPEGKEIPLNEETLLQFSPRALDNIWEFCQAKINGD